MSDPQSSSGLQPGKSLLSEYREQMILRKDLAHDEEARERIEQMIELVDDLDALFEHG